MARLSDVLSNTLRADCLIGLTTGAPVLPVALGQTGFLNGEFAVTLSPLKGDECQMVREWLVPW